MLKYLVIFFFILSFANSSANNKNKIIENLNNTKNLNFKFEQNLNGKIETGNCTIEYPKKIFCKYNGSKKKILVSNGRKLVIKTVVGYYIYPLKKTPLDKILDKKFIINNIHNLEEKIIDNSYINYTIIENNNEINIFFDNQTFNLIGWQTKDIYQNSNITFISSIKKNQIIAKNLFKLPSQN